MLISTIIFLELFQFILDPEYFYIYYAPKLQDIFSEKECNLLNSVDRITSDDNITLLLNLNEEAVIMNLNASFLIMLFVYPYYEKIYKEYRADDGKVNRLISKSSKIELVFEVSKHKKNDVYCIKTKIL